MCFCGGSTEEHSNVASLIPAVFWIQWYTVVTRYDPQCTISTQCTRVFRLDRQSGDYKHQIVPGNMQYDWAQKLLQIINVNTIVMPFGVTLSKYFCCMFVYTLCLYFIMLFYIELVQIL